VARQAGNARLLRVKRALVLVVGDSLVEEKIGGGNIQEVTAQIYKAVLKNVERDLGIIGFKTD